MKWHNNSELRLDDIIGESSALKRTLELTKRAAATDAAVLVFGERGSGKELIARAIHRVSLRRNNSFITVTSAAAAGRSLASELFGESVKKPGRLELANGGTLFLDEIADFPPDLQARLLEMLERREFQRAGSSTVRVNVRFIAATRYDLGKLVAEGRFRQDLFDQVNASLIRIPSLRERRDDIPLLAHYFMQKFSRRVNKNIRVIPPEVLQTLIERDWPGNVRELESFIQRSVALTEGSTLLVPPAY